MSRHSHVWIPISALLLSDALLLIGHGLTLTLLPIAAVDAGFTNFQVAITGSAYFLGFVMGCIATPHVLKRVGHIRSFAVLATLYSAVVLLFPWFEAFIAWSLLRFIVGLCIAGLYMIIESWLNERANAENRGTVLSVYTMLNMLMITAGQQLLNLGTISSYQLFTIAAILVSLAIIPVSLTLSIAPAEVKSVKINLAMIWRHSNIGMIGAVISGLVTGAFWSLAPVYASASGFDKLQLTLFMSAAVMGGALFQVPLGRLSDKFDRRLVLSATSVFGAVASCAFVLVPGVVQMFEGYLVIALSFFWGGAVMTQYAICLAHANDDAEPEDFVTIGSGMLLTLGICSAIGAPVASWLMHVMGPNGLFAFSAVSLIVFAVATIVRKRFHELDYEPEEAEPFRAVTEMATPVSLELDPRMEHDDDHIHVEEEGIPK